MREHTSKAGFTVELWCSIHFSYLSDGLTFTNKPYDSQPKNPAVFHGRAADQRKIPLLTTCARTAHHRTQCTSTVTRHANTRGSRANTAQDCALWCLFDQRHVSHVAALVTEHLHTISFTYLTYQFSPSELYQETLRGGVADALNLHLPQIMSPIWSNPTTSSLQEMSFTGILEQIRIKYWKEFWEMTIKILSQKIRRKLALRPIEDTPMLTRILKENCEKCWPQSCMYPQLQGNQKRKIMQKRGACAQRTQADHSRRESLKSNSSQEPRASGKPDAVSSSSSGEPGNQCKSSVIKYADPSNLGTSLLEGNEDHSFSQAGVALMGHEHQVGSLNICISELSNKLMFKDWNYRTLNTDMMNLDENKFDYKTIYL